MTRRFSTPRGITRVSPRRGREWHGAFGSNNIPAGDAGGTIIVDNPTLDEMTSATLMRTRGEILVRLETGAVAGSKEFVGFGLQVVRDVTVTEFELPLTHLDSSQWFWHHYALLSAENTGADVETVWQRIEVDSKAMRKLTETDKIILVTENTSGGGDAGIDVMFAFRLLFQEPR